MKSVWVFGIIHILLLPLLAIGCDSGGNTKTVEITLDQFAENNQQVVNIEIKKDASLIVRLGSNPTTGYQWGEAVITGTDLISQTDRSFVEPKNTDMVGAPGVDVWTFNAYKTGSASINFSYGRSWEPEGIYTLKISVTVK